jgi:hypothetical protein
MKQPIATVVVNLGVQDIRFSDPYDPAGPVFLPLGGKRASPTFAEVLGQPCTGLRASAAAAHDLLRRDWEAWRPCFSFPILVPALRRIAQECRGRIDRLFLLATDQDDPVHRHQDTATLATLLAEFGPTLADVAIGEIRILPIRDHPNLLSAALPQVAAGFRSIGSLPPNGRLYLSSSPGIPAVNQAMLWQALRQYGPLASYYQVIEPPEEDLMAGRESTEVQIHHLGAYLAEFALGSLTVLLGQRNYAGAGEVLNGARELFVEDVSLAGSLVRAAELRLALDFQNSAEVAAAAVGDAELGPPALALQQRLPYPLAEMGELLASIGVLLERDNYHDAVWRVRSFVELAQLAAQDGMAVGVRIEVQEMAVALGDVTKLRNKVVHYGLFSADALNSALPAKLRPARTRLAPWLREVWEVLVYGAGHEVQEVDYSELNRRVLAYLRARTGGS